ncbi:polycomb protein Asx-like [Lutzomyia longipalpis]|uniref:polycomb protein Asx-like n=1 Tax=Lutzomyia longipalpis TaxID=7200 RepID=UPI002483C038|nr:polycomb protein Asx-like [Lutzomyia longipalpis]
MESATKAISIETAAPRDAGSMEYAEDIAEQENCAESCQHDSEYNTASDSTTSETGIEKVNQKIEVIEISDEEENDDEGPDDEEDEDEDDEGSSLESGEEEDDAEGTPGQMPENKKQVDDDEDRSNPQYIPKRGTFYEHDDRTAENADAEAEEESQEGEVSEKKVSFNTPVPAAAKTTKKWQSSSDRWSHDRYDESEQAPKSKAELVSAYGYDIRNEESPPRARRRRRYGRGPSKYTRKWEDENAYGKASNRRIALNSKDEFPEIDENTSGRAHKRRGEKNRGSGGGGDGDYEYYGRNNQSGGYVDGGGNDGHYGRMSYENNQLKPKNQSSGFRVKSSIEFKNQNRMRQNASNAATGMEHNRQESFIVTRNNNMSNAQMENNMDSMGKMEHHVEEQQSHGGGGGEFKARPQQHHQHHQQQQIHNLNGNEFAEFVPTYMHNQMGQEAQHQQHPMHHSQMTQPSMMLQRDMQHTYTGDSVKMLQQQQQPGVRAHNQASTASTNLIPMGMSSGDNMRQTPKRYSSLRQRAVMGSGGQMLPPSAEGDLQQQHQTVGNQERLKISPPVQKPQKYDGLPPQEHHEIDSPKLKMRQPKAHHSQQAPPQTLQAPQQPPILTQTTPPSTNYYAPEYIRQPQLPAHRPAPQAAAKNHATLPGQAYQPQFAANNAAPAFVAPPAQTTPAFIAPPPQSTNPQPILNYVTPPPTMGPTQAQYPSYPNYPNYNSLTTPSIPHQSQGGITYYAPQSQPPPRPVVAQRRPTNAIPILAPPERSGSGKGRGRLPASSQQTDEGEPGGDGKSNVENIDHILDNMFTRRTPYEQPSLKASSSPPVSPVTVKSDPSSMLSLEQTEDALKNLSVSEQTDAPGKGIRTEESPSAGDVGPEEK